MLELQNEIKSFDFSFINNLAKNKHKKAYQGIVQYGTAGFRTRATSLDHVLFRMGLLTVLRSQVKKATIGLMITASHNLEIDNGVKVVDPNGEMLETSWEIIATKLANVEDDKVISILQEIIKEQNIDTSLSASVIIGRDTRSSSLNLSQAAVSGIKAMNSKFIDVGVVTTPQLHYFVVSMNKNRDYGIPALEGYYKKISEAYKKIIETTINNGKYSNKVQLDAANGVGALAIKELKKYLNGALNIEIYNSGEGQLNYMCGADYVKQKKISPLNIPINPYVKCVSIDGDADRIVYYYIDKYNQFHLLDGDRIAILVADYLKELLQQSHLNLQLGLVQTAYANGNSTVYISDTLNIPVACVRTGVKYLHHKALEFDIGVYFESNGHGTVVFNESAINTIYMTANNNSLSSIQRKAAQTLSYVIDVVNQTVGDAISDMLLVELILHAKGWDIVTWKKSYSDLPNKQVKIEVQDRNAIITTNEERCCIKPKELQKEIDKIVTKYEKGRSFVRSSGTEDVVRIYVECENDSDIDKMAAEVSLAVYELAGGIGIKPIIPESNKQI
ncbi:PREDICTED: phosphoacetylglucosamine mutase [Ceratosolen solmsi marchali]|uniref:Phosphoacetylglucosamine mutase n=1 Tax=Ceratosolen solmsi marchali TaxID=326594 RepID=A0AAJ6YN82_9HYME|nr:PREDICTED: phosphoacetylglucosamine mutase [Ceratosolen solmsi marchali]